MKTKTTKKTGFTLAEMLIAMAIIGVTLVAAMTAMKQPKDIALKYLYINAYNSLAKAYYNGALIGYNPFTANKVDELDPEHTAEKDTGTELICRGLTTYINTSTNEKLAEDKKEGDTVVARAHDYSASCDGASGRFSSEMGTSADFAPDKVMFTATNGMKFYITNRLGGTDDVYFYIVYVDVNGDNGPNSLGDNFSPKARAEGTNTNPLRPDIFAFALLDTGRVCPLGIPEYDTEILTARFVYGPQGDLVSPKSMAYYQAKGAAWGAYGSSGQSQNLMTNYNLDEQYSMNDKIRDMIKEKTEGKSKIVEGFPKLEDEAPVEVATGESPSGEPYACSHEDLESCYIFLDEYRR